MNKMLTSAMLIGVGALAYNYAQKNKLMTNRQMKKLRKRVMNAF